MGKRGEVTAVSSGRVWVTRDGHGSQHGAVYLTPPPVDSATYSGELGESHFLAFLG